MTKAEKYNKICQMTQALKALVRCNQDCLVKNHRRHDDNCTISLADEYVKIIYGVMGIPDE